MHPTIQTHLLARSGRPAGLPLPLHKPIYFASIVLTCITLCGCGASTPQPLNPDAFYTTPARVVGETPLRRTDRSGQLSQQDTQSEPGTPPPPGSGDSTEGISDAVRDVVRLPGAESATRPSDATRPTTMATTEPVFSSGQYMTLGSLVAEVNGTPIYANKVLRLDAIILRDLAREYDVGRFQVAARDRIEKTTGELVHNELEYAAAIKALDSQDRQIADVLTQRWRDHQISQAGGSVELARQRARAEGQTFEEQVQDQHRLYLIQLYYTRKLNPLVQVTRDDMYRYYQVHQDSEFTKHEQASIRLIKADPKLLDAENPEHGKEMAIARLQDYRKRALEGQDFAALAESDNHFRDMFKDSGYVIPITPGSFALTKVDAAVWKLQQGQISDVIQDRGGFYLFKVESRDAAGTQPFSEPAVQDKIATKLRTEQMQKLRDAEQRKLMESAMIRSDATMIDACVEMAMENYPKWSAK